MITTTLNEIKKHDPCGRGWDTFLAYLNKTEADDEPIALTEVLKSNGLGDAIWCFRVVPGGKAIAVEFAKRCAARAEQYPLGAADAASWTADAASWAAVAADRAVAAAAAAAVAAAAAANADWTAAQVAECKKQKQDCIELCGGAK